MTPELLKAIEFHEREHFQALGHELQRIERSLERTHAAQGTFRHPAFFGALISGKVDALADNLRADADS